MKNRMTVAAIAIPIGVTLFFTFFSLALVLYPIMTAKEAVLAVVENVGNFGERLGNWLLFRGWCTAEECYEKEEENYYKQVGELHKKYANAPYSIDLNMELIQATIFYNADYDVLFNPNAGTSEDNFDYRAAKNQLNELVGQLVYRDSKGKYYQDVGKYDAYLRDRYIDANFRALLNQTTKEQIILDIHSRAGYYADTSLNEEDSINGAENITGTILDLLDAPFHNTECAITSPFTSLRGSGSGAKAHFAVDVVGKTNKNIYSVYDGIVVAVVHFDKNLSDHWDREAHMCNCGTATFKRSCAGGYGNFIIVEHTIEGVKYRSRYAHLSSIMVTEGQSVSKGEQIGVEGNTGCSTGSHMHFEFYEVDGQKLDPTPIMSRCATQSSIIATCDLNKLRVKLTECTDTPATFASTVVKEVSFKEYVMGVMYGVFIGKNIEPEALKALAVVVQTKSLKLGDYGNSGQYIFIRNCSKDQQYEDINSAPPNLKQAIETAVNEVFGITLMKDGRLMSGEYATESAFGCGYGANKLCLNEIEGLAAINKMNATDILNHYYTDPQVDDYCKSIASQSTPGINNAKPTLTCGALDATKTTDANNKLKKKVDAAGRGTRAGVVAAARYLAIDFEFKVPFYASEDPLKGRYFKEGLYTDATSGWGCNVTKAGAPTVEQQIGSIYPNGLDSVGFVSWAILNGGINKGELGYSFVGNMKDKVPFGDERVTNGTIKVGDLFWDGGHAGVIIGIDDVNIYVAEEKGIANGLIVTSYSKTNTMPGNYYISMASYYPAEGTIPNMW